VEVDIPVSGPSLTNARPSICFVALQAYNVFSGREDLNYIGGAEVQQLQIASWVVHQGYSVSVITLDHGQPDGVVINGIKVFKAYVTESGIRGLRFFHPRWSGLWSAMTRANADIYYQRGPECETGQVALWCHLHRRKFIFAAANAASCNPELLALESWRDRTLYRIGLSFAHAVIAQTMAQQSLFRRNMGISAGLIRSCGWELTNETSHKSSAVLHAGRMRVLWVGRISEVKRFEWLLDVAEQCPEITFDVVGAPGTYSNYASSLIRRAAGISNVKMHGRIPYVEMAKYYQDCHILCCTSAYEGFPNTFLEAWTLGIPVVSTFDPDGVIAANGLGLVAQDVEGIVACLRKVVQSPEIWLKVSKAAKQYYLANHTPEVCLPILERLFLEVAGY